MNCITNENPKIQENWLWRKNVPFIYDYLFMTPLKWPTLSFTIPPIRFNSENMEIEQAMTDLDQDPEIYSHGQLVIYGSYTGKNIVNDTECSKSGVSDNYIAISLIDVPNFDIDLLNANEVQKNTELKKPKYLNPDINTLFGLSVEDDIFKICSGIDNNKLKLASKTIKGKIIVHNIDIDEIKDMGINLRKRNEDKYYDDENSFFNNRIVSALLGNEHNSTGKSGYGMEWGTTNSNWLLSGNEDSSIYIYDLNTNNVVFESIDGCCLSGGINDLSWLNPDLTPNIFTTVNHQGNLSVYDFRINKKAKGNSSSQRVRLRSDSISNYTTPVGRWTISDNPCLSVSVHPCISNLISVGCYDGSIFLVDLRYFSNINDVKNSSNKKFIVNRLEYGKKGVHRVEWHAGGNGLLLSSSLNGKVAIWDITKSNNLPIWDQFHSNCEDKTSNNYNYSTKSKKNQINSENSGLKDETTALKNSLKAIVGSKSSWNKSERLEGPDELLGIHSGHLGHVTDSHWIYSPDFDSWTVASSDSSNGFHIWCFNEALFSSENDLIELAYAKDNPVFQNSDYIFSTKASIQNLIDSF
ncbi:hypothetical protein FG386_003567 [Cryptosporidium ryanae]|uniref:uncharacterized protein n=1 Tax=Cryptosporidium ryanae TaxID=515981 RepID=UPI00351A9BE2|nr:hypothetical protein FG386_003567 [Cryptosporidium ryanae]